MSTVYIDGAWHSDKTEAKISVYDHGLLYGDGIFEGIRVYGGSIFKCSEHLNRLKDSAKVLCLELPETPDKMEEIMKEGIKREGKENVYIRLIVTRGAGSLGINPHSCSVPSLIIIFDDISLYPEEYYKKGIDVITASTRRLSGDVLDPRVKSLNYLTNIMGKLEAKRAGCMEAVMLNRGGYVTECTADNIFCLKDGVLNTPASYLGILEGITRNTVMELAEKEGIPIKEAVLTCYDLYTSDEIFLTGSGAELIPVINVDGRVIGTGNPGENFKRLRKAFQKLVFNN